MLDINYGSLPSSRLEKDHMGLAKKGGDSPARKTTLARQAPAAFPSGRSKHWVPCGQILESGPTCADCS